MSNGKTFIGTDLSVRDNLEHIAGDDTRALTCYPEKSNVVPVPPLKPES